MYRYAVNDLIAWKNSPNYMPLIIKGARQVGKTWLMQEFGKTQYEKVAYISFDSNPRLDALFQKDLNVKRLLDGLKLIIFDEIQENPLALASLKYFSENASEYNIVAAGSLLGVAHHKKKTRTKIKEEQIAYVEDWINNRPMKILNYMTPKQKLQHFSVAIAS